MNIHTSTSIHSLFACRFKTFLLKVTVKRKDLQRMHCCCGVNRKPQGTELHDNCQFIPTCISTTFVLIFAATGMSQLPISQQVGLMVWHSVQLSTNTGEF
jgi:hypothetical protein